MNKLRRFYEMLGGAMAAALGLLGVAVWAVNGGKAFLYGGCAVFVLSAVLLAVCGRRTKKSEARTHGLARVCLTAVVVTLAGCTVALPTLHMTRRAARLPVSAGSLIGDTTLVGHRGFSCRAPQNTLPSLTLAGEIGMDGCEFDVHTTKDGVWIVNHDDTVDHMTDGSGNISDYTYEELQAFTVDNGNYAELFPGVLKLPTLDEALSALEGTGTFPVIEIKNCDPARFPALLEAVRAYGFEENALVISFTMDYLREIRRLDPAIRMSFLTSDLTEADVEQCAALGNTGVDVNVQSLPKIGAALRLAREKGLETICWTVDYPILALLARCYGIRTITTNRIAPQGVDFGG